MGETSVRTTSVGPGPTKLTAYLGSGIVRLCLTEREGKSYPWNVQRWEGRCRPECLEVRPH